VLKLHVREIVATLPGDAHDPAPDLSTPQVDDIEWHDSSLELERGLDVLELPIDIATPAPAPAPADKANVVPRLPPER